jgi:branched-chain amino acid transport system permease protein
MSPRPFRAADSGLARIPQPVPLVLFGLLAMVPLLASITGQTHVIGLFARMMIFALAALGLDLLVGYGALVSFGHAAFVGIGAYTVGILDAHGVHDIAVVLPVTVLAAAGFAAATGTVSLRTRGVHFIMITLAFGQMAFFTAGSLAPYGGDDGLTVGTRNTFLGFAPLARDVGLYYVVFAVLLSVYVVMRLLVASRFGRVLRAARENPVRVAALGFDVHRFQLAAYVVSGVTGAFAGVLLANATDFVSPAYMSWQRSGELIIMVLLGGMGSLHGAIIGALAFLLLEEWLAGLTEHWKIIFGPLLVAIVLFARGGLVGFGPAISRRWRRG